MKSEETGESERLLYRALREWKIKGNLPPRFEESVWQRIARQEAQAGVKLWTWLSGWLAQALRKPSLAVSYVTILFVAGLLAGYWEAKREKVRTLETLSARYVQMVDPYQARG